MPDSPDYRAYLEKSFEDLTKIMNLRFDAVHEKLSDIVKQNEIRNGRIEATEEEVERIEEKLDKAVEYAHHVIDSRATECPNVKRIAASEQGVSDLKTWKTSKEAVDIHDQKNFTKTTSWLMTLAPFLILLVTFYFGMKRVTAEVKTTNDSYKNELMLQNEILLQQYGFRPATRGIFQDSLEVDSATEIN